MKQTILSFLFLLTLIIVNSTAKAQLIAQKPAFHNSTTKEFDTLKNQFQLKKSSVKGLIIGQSVGTLLKYYEFYLQEKDLNRADSLINRLINLTNAPYLKHQLSLTSYRYTGDTKTHLLFITDSDKVSTYRTYFSTVKVSSLKTNGAKWAHYYNLVALDSAYHQGNPDSLEQKKMSQHYNSLAWYSILNQKLGHVEYYLNQSIKYNPQSKDPYANLPLLYLLQGKYSKAKALYIKYKEEPFDGPEFTFKDEFLVDFKELAAAGITNKYITRISNLLNSK